MLRESVVVVVRTRPRAIPLAMITMTESTHGFLFVFHMSMGLRLAALGAAGARYNCQLRFSIVHSNLFRFHTFYNNISSCVLNTGWFFEKGVSQGDPPPPPPLCSLVHHSATNSLY